MKDKDENFEQQRDFIEYHASFIEPQAVKKIREARERSIELNDDEFSKNVSEMFGRDIKLERPNGVEKKVHTVDMNQVLRNMREKPIESNTNKMLKSEFWKDLG